MKVISMIMIVPVYPSYISIPSAPQLGQCYLHKQRLSDPNLVIRSPCGSSDVMSRSSNRAKCYIRIQEPDRGNSYVSGQ
jgi:hypothetical protein